VYRWLAPVVAACVLAVGSPAFATDPGGGVLGEPVQFPKLSAPDAMARAANVALHTDPPGAASPMVPDDPPQTPEAHPTAVTRPDSTSALAEAAALGDPVEITDLRAESTSTLANPDGTLSLEAYAGPVRLRSGTGWVDVDTTLVNLGARVAPRAAKGNVSFSAGGTGELASISSGQRRFAVSWPAPLPAPVLSGNTATYRSVLPGVDLVLRATRMGYEQTFVVRAKPAAPLRLVETVSVDGLAVALGAHDEIELTDESGELVAVAAGATMWGAGLDEHSGDPARTTAVETNLIAGGTAIELLPGADFLNDEGVDYPVTIDPSPSLTLQGDTWVQTSYVNTAQYGSTMLKSGTYNGGSDIARSFVKFDVSSILDKNVSASTLKLYNWYSYSCNSSAHKRTDIFPLTSGFNPSTVWGNKPNYSTAATAYASFDYGYSSSCPGNWGVFSNMTGIAQLWANRTQTNYGIVVKANSETDNLAWKKFYSQDNGSNIPYLQVTYTSDPNAPTSLSPANNAQLTSLTPTISAVVSDPDGGTVKAQFGVYDNASGATIYTSTFGTSVNSGSRSSLAVASGKLAYGHTYRWHVRAYDGVNYGGFTPSTGWYYFTVNSTVQKPSSPLVTATPANGTAVVNWDPPADNGGATITAYKLYVYAGSCVLPPSSATAFKYYSLSNATFSQSVTGLANGTSYCFEVTATNSAGESVAGTDTGTPHGLAQILKTAVGNAGQAQPVYAFGQTVTYTIRVTNPETAGTMSGVTVSDAIPDVLDVSAAKMWLDSAACDPAVCLLDDHNLSVTMPDIAAGQYRTLTYQVTIPTSETLGCLAALVNTASATDVAGTVSDSETIYACNNGLGIEPWWSYVGMPLGPQASARVNAANGNVVVEATDATPVTDHGRLGLIVRRVYNSAEATLATLPGSLGAGWQLNVGQNDDLAGTGVGSTTLYVPTAESIATPLAVTLIDRDGTRHVFRPNSVAVDPLGTGAVASLRPALLGLGSGFTGLCVDQTYTAPPGVHLGLWRYIETTATGCSGLTNANSRLLGFAAVRPDRVRYEWAATGQLLSQSDGAGNRLDYVYDNAPDGVPTGALGGISLNLGNLRAVYDPHACTATTNPVTLAGIPDPCRAIRLYYPSATELDVYDPAARPNNANGRGPTRYYFDTAQPKHLIEVINPDDTANLPGLTTLDPASAATRPDRIYYKYGAQCAGSGANANQLCSVSSQRDAAVVTSFKYGTSASGLPGEMPRVASIVDRRGTTTTFTYGASSTGSGTSTTVDANPGQSTGTHRKVYDDIDGQGRVGKLTEGDAATTGPNTIGTTYFTWDGRSYGFDGVQCQYPSNGLDNNLCLVQRIAGATGGTPDEETAYTFNDEGGTLTTHKCLNATVVTPHIAACAPAPSPNALDETNGFRAQYFTTSGATPLVYDDVVAGSGTVSAAPGRPVTGVLFAVSDRTASLTARGNEAANVAVKDRYTTTYRVDNVTTAAPGTFNAAGSYCDGSGNGTANTGLLCAVDAPSFALASPSLHSTTRYAYNGFGERATMATPKAVADGSSAHYTYTYFANQADTDLSGTVYAGGWLKAVTDPAGNFVAFAYDAAGNPVRSWDRDATHGHTLSQFTGAGYVGGGAAPAYAETKYGTFAAPWRYVTSSSDQLGNTTRYTVDQHGNQTAIQPPRGTAANNNLYDVTQVFDNGDLRTSVQQPEEAAASKKTAFTYDVFGNLTITTDPLGHVQSSAYDAKSRKTDAYVSRIANPATIPAGCSRASTAPVVGFPATSSSMYCRTSIAYDMVENPVSTTDASGQTTTLAYDGAHRRTRTVAPRNDGTSSTLTTQVIYDSDGHQLVVCPPRQLTEGGAGTCTTTGGYYSAHATFDYAGRVATSTVYRDSAGTQPITTTFDYDADGNQTSLRDARGVTATATFDLLDRVQLNTVPRTVDAFGNTTLSFTTAKRYSDAGDLLGVFAPGEVSDNPAVSGTTRTRYTGYAYDAAHRLTDTVSALQLSGTDPGLTMSVDALVSAIASATTTATTNRRSRSLYDADGHVVAQYDPRAFTGSGTPTSPDNKYVVRTDFDRDGRPVLQLVPRYDTSAASDQNADASMSAQCGPGSVATSHGYPATTGVCQTSVTYDAAGRSSVVRLPSYTASKTNRTLTYGYTDDNLLRTTTGPSPASDGTQATLDTREYDGAGRLVTQTNAVGHATTTVYSSDGLVREIDGPAGPAGLNHQTRYTYDANGNGTSTVRPRTAGGVAESAMTYMTYTADNLLAQMRSPGSGLVGVDFDVTTYAYDKIGNTTSVTSPSANAGDANNTAGVGTVNTFTADNLLVSTTQPVGANGTARRRTTFTYDSAGRQTSAEADLVDPVGNVTTGGQSPQQLTYTPLDQVATQQGRGGNGCLRTTYDVAGNAVSIGDTRGASCAGGGTTTTYTATYYLDGLLRTAAQNGRSTALSYDGAGAVTARTDDTSAGRLTTTYVNDDAGLVTSMVAPLSSGTAATFTYTNAGQPASRHDTNGQTVVWSYGSDDTLTDMGVTSSGGAAEDTARNTYTYDEHYRKLTQTYTGKDATALHLTGLPVTYSFAYNPAGRLASFTNSGLLVTDQTKNATWDHDGNRLTYGTRTFTYNADDSIATGSAGSSDPPRTHAEDPEGRTTGDGCTTSAYDGFDRLTSVTPTGASNCPAGTVTYTYDGLDRQTARTEGSATTSFFYSGAGTTAIAEAGSGANEVGYALDPSELPVVARKTGSGAATHYLAEDGTGSVATVTDTAGAVACTARYNPFGEPQGNTVAPVTGSCNSGATPSTMFYRAGRKDAATGAYQLGSRTYDPGKSGFLTPDSYRTGGSGAQLSVGTDPLTANRYTYVNGDPVNFVDPSGHRRFEDWFGRDEVACDATCALEQRYAYNRAKVEQRIAEGNAVNPRPPAAPKPPNDGLPHPMPQTPPWTDYYHVADLQKMLDDVDQNGGHIYDIDFDKNHGNGEMVIVYGDLLNAQNIGVSVPGLDSTIYAGGVRNNARRLRDKNDSSTATIAWLGYDAPEKNTSVITQGRARDGAKKLGAFMKELNIPDDKNVTLVGHSYGSLVVGHALKTGAVHVDNVVVVGSPGMSVHNASGLHLDGTNFWAGGAPGDFVAATYQFGMEPQVPGFGSMPMPMGGNHGHSSYFNENTDSHDFMLRIVRGDYRRQCFSAADYD
jgi:RHS repeat-associated protein/fimbrial isopeptide formation D2 family protein